MHAEMEAEKEPRISVARRSPVRHRHIQRLLPPRRSALHRSVAGESDPPGARGRLQERLPDDGPLLRRASRAFSELYKTGCLEGFRGMPYSWARRRQSRTSRPRLDNSYREARPRDTVRFRLHRGTASTRRRVGGTTRRGPPPPNPRSRRREIEVRLFEKTAREWRSAPRPRRSTRASSRADAHGEPARRGSRRRTYAPLYQSSRRTPTPSACLKARR